MIKIITYGTYDLLHFGHIRLLERAKALGDYLIVGVTADDFDRARGKINVQQSLMERIEAVRQTGLADEIIVEEYEGQKIDDIKRYDVDIFAVGSDWQGVFDYLGEYCQVVYLPRTKGISSTELRAAQTKIRMGFVGSYSGIRRYADEVQYVNGMELTAVYCSRDKDACKAYYKDQVLIAETYDQLLESSDAVYIVSHPSLHYEQILRALEAKKHVLCESPITLSTNEMNELYTFADSQGLVLMDSIKTAYSTAFNRLTLLVKSGKIGDVVSVDAVCTSLAELQMNDVTCLDNIWNSICAWGPTAFLPVFHILGTDYRQKQIVVNYLDKDKKFDRFAKISFTYSNAVASILVGKGIKSEGELVISGTKGYIYVPAPWWKTDYFEIRYEDQSQNKRFFYQLEGDGIRYLLACFARMVSSGNDATKITRAGSKATIQIIEDFYNNRDIFEI